MNLGKKECLERKYHRAEDKAVRDLQIKRKDKMGKNKDKEGPFKM